MRSSRRLLLVTSLAAATCLPGRLALAGDSDPESAPAPLPPLPARSADEAPATPPSSTPAVDRSMVRAGVVQTNHVDTVVVAEPGSNVTVHGGRGRSDKYEPDSARKAAIIASPLFFGIGGAVFGIAYLSQKGSQRCTYDSVSGSVCMTNNAVPALVAYDATVALVPSIPRAVVGDVNGALIYSGLRGASVLVASLVSWGDDSSSWMGPFTLGFAVPVTLAIVDLATTPHREDLRPHDEAPSETAAAAPRVHVTSVTPAAVTDSENHVRGAMVHLSATF
jgi:hypothetical protein